MLSQKVSRTDSVVVVGSEGGVVGGGEFIKPGGPSRKQMSTAMTKRRGSQIWILDPRGRVADGSTVDCQAVRHTVEAA